MKGFVYDQAAVTLQYDQERCVGCTMCATVCLHRVFRMKGKKAVLVDASVCIECGACATNCPSNAISVNPGVGCASGIINGWLREIAPRFFSGGGCCE